MAKKILATIGAALIAATSAWALRIIPLPEGVNSYRDRIYLSGAPNKEMIQTMRSIGVRVMVDLREENEGRSSTEEEARKNGIVYFSVPLSRAGPLRSDPVDAVETILHFSRFRQIWVFCGSGNRAAAWFAVHLAKSSGYTHEQAIEEAQRLGLQNPQMLDKVRAYLDEKP